MFQSEELASLREKQLIILQKLLTGDEKLTKEAEEETASIGILQGYHYNLQASFLSALLQLSLALLLDIYLDKSHPSDLRWIAAITFKNGIYRYWRRPAAGCIKYHEKIAISKRLIELDCSDSKIINIHYNLAVATVVRWDFPGFWPTAFSDLVEAVELTKNATDASTKPFREYNALNVLHLAIKATSTRALPTQRAAFRSFASAFVPKLATWYKEYFTLFFDQQTFSIDYLTKLSTCIKMARRVLCFGIKDPQLDASANQLFGLITSSLQSLFGIYSALDMSDCDEEFAKMVLKSIFSVGKLLLEFLKYNPSSFIAMEHSQSIIHWYGTFLLSQEFENTHLKFSSSSDENTGLNFSRFHLQALLLFKSLSRSLAFQNEVIDINADEGHSKFINVIKSSILTNDFVTQLVGNLINRYMILTDEDLRQWESSPEDWISAEESDQWETDVRACSEKLFLDIFTEFKDIILPPLLLLLNSSTGCSIAQRDAIYTAVGLSASEVSKMINFNDWLETYLVDDMQQTVPRSELLRRRVVWLIGKWMAAGLVTEKKDLLYEILIKSLSPAEPSLVVRLSAVSSMKECLNEWDFDPEAFTIHSGNLIGQLIILFQTVGLDESKPFVLNCLSCLVERLRSYSLSHLNVFVEFIPWLWVQVTQRSIEKSSYSQKDPMLLISALILTTNLINAFGMKSEVFHPLVKEMVEFSCSPASPEQIFLIEYGTDLWVSALRQANELSIPLLQLFELLCIIMNSEITEFITDHFKIVENYFLLGIPRFLLAGFLGSEANINNISISGIFSNSEPSALFESLINSIPRLVDSENNNSELVAALMSTLDLIIATTFNFCGASGVLPIASSERLLTTLLQAASDDSGYLPTSKAKSAIIFARFTVVFSQDLLVFIQHISQHTNKETDKFYQEIVDLLILGFNAVVSTKRKNLIAYALSLLVGCRSDLILDKIPLIISNVWLSFAADLGALPDMNGDTGDYEEYSEGELELTVDSAETKRKAEFKKLDMVSPIKILQSVKSALSLHEAEVGPQTFYSRVTSNVDSDSAAIFFGTLSNIN